MTGAPTRWGFVSVAAPAVGFIVGVAILTEGWRVSGTRDFRDAVFWGLSVWGASSALGIVAAGIAWTRTERLWMVTAAGFALSAILPALLLYAGAASLLNWLRYG